MKIEYVSFSQKMRKILDASFAKKGMLFWIFSPVLFLISFIFAFVAKVRRQKGYARFDSLPVSLPDSLHVVCIGNILVGGTGKSPLVRACASQFLKNDAIIAIASRGIGAGPVIIDSLSYTKEIVDKLSDENREHFEILRNQFPKQKFYIFQNKNRRNSLNTFISYVSQIKNKKSIFILDDGLQHFDCPRHENICVQDAQLHKTAPPFAMPVGPYREGFGKNYIKQLLASFDRRIWTNSGDIPRVVRNFVARTGTAQFPSLEHGIQDLSTNYKLCFVKFQIFQNGEFEFHPIENISLEIFQKPLVLAGIAHPERFFASLKSISKQFDSCDTYFLSDHGLLTSGCLKRIEQTDVLFLTLKDFFRFCTDKNFISVCSTRKVYGCYPEYFFH